MTRIFRHHNIDFKLRGVTRTKNAAWSNMENLLQMNSHLRKGDFASLNMYFLSGFFNGTGNLGQTYNLVKFDGDEDSDSFYLDGTINDINTMPGGKEFRKKDETYTNFNSLGRSAVHEVGHWLGLYHVFASQTKNPCSADDRGDGVDDNPQQSEPTNNGCSTSKRHNNFCSITPKAQRT